ncbi:hypothetical protein GCM10017710_27530 [Arthrobacter ramosus]
MKDQRTPPPANSPPAARPAKLSTTYWAGSTRGFACAGQDNASGRPVEEVCAEMGLEPLDNATQRRLGDVKALGGPAEMERFRNRKE